MFIHIDISLIQKKALLFKTRYCSNNSKSQDNKVNVRMNNHLIVLIVFIDSQMHKVSNLNSKKWLYHITFIRNDHLRYSRICKLLQTNIKKLIIETCLWITKRK